MKNLIEIEQRIVGLENLFSAFQHSVAWVKEVDRNRGKGIKGDAIESEITKLRAAIASTKGNLKLLENILNLVSDGIFLVDGHFRFVLVNAQVCRFLGLTPKEWVGELAEGLALPDQRESVRRALSKSLHGKGTNLRLAVKRGKGDCRSLMVKLQPFAWREEKHVLGIARDLTDMERRESELHRIKHEQEAVLDGIPAMVYFKDRENRFLRVNQAFAGEVGLSKERLEGMSAFDLASDKKLGALRWQDDQEVMMTGIPKRNIVEPFPLDSNRWLQTDKIPYKNSHGEVVGIIGFSIDVTEKKAAFDALQNREKELRFKSDNLEELSIALKVLLENREKEKAETAEEVLYNMKRLVEPHLEKLLKSNLDKKQKAYASALDSNLKKIVSPMLQTLNASYRGITPGELSVADLVKQGKRTKEIAEILDLSPKTIESYRKSLRRKLGIDSKKVNLRTHLLSLQ